MPQEVSEKIITATIKALEQTTGVRFFKTERGYQGRFYCILQAALDGYGIIDGETILEMEYQKAARHETSQRPDIVLHIPSEVSRMSVTENNFSVWALKRKASRIKAKKDFDNLDIMFNTLKYPLGFFINIGSKNHHLDTYDGRYPDRIIAFAVFYNENNNTVSITKAWWENRTIRTASL